MNERTVLEVLRVQRTEIGWEYTSRRVSRDGSYEKTPTGREVFSQGYYAPTPVCGPIELLNAHIRQHDAVEFALADGSATTYKAVCASLHRMMYNKWMGNDINE